LANLDCNSASKAGQKYLVLIMKSILLILCLLVAGSHASELSQNLESIFQQYNADNVPGAAVMIISDAEIVTAQGYGMANIEQNIPVSANSNFRLASVTKQFTAMSILQLIANGQLSLDTTLTEIFPEFPSYGENINIGQILQHTSGLTDYEEFVDDSVTDQLKDKDVLNMMLATNAGYFSSGEKYQYSNTGYAVLSQVLEKLTGQPFRDYLQENIFKPLAMDNTLAYEHGINQVPDRAYGYSRENDEILLTDQNIYSAILGDGGIYSNLQDLYLWDQALYTNRLLPDELMAQSFVSGVDANGVAFDYGFGWRLETYKDMDVVYHTGSSIGFRTIIYRIPMQKFSVVILTNLDREGEFSSLELAHKVVDLYF